MMNYVSCPVLLLLLALPAAAQQPFAPATSPANTQTEQNIPVIRFGEKRAIHSKILNEDRPYWVYLPSSHQGSVNRRYPVLYVLDGDTHFEWVCGMVRFMSEINGNFQIPETIVVTIPNTNGNRTRDFTPTHTMDGYDGIDDPTLASSGGGKSFEQFLERELVPRIETDYRTAPYRIIAGHSLGGLLVLDALLRRPSVFQAYVAIDPSTWWDDRLLLRMAKEILPKAPYLRQQVYVSLANNLPGKDFDPKVVENASRDLVRLLQTNNPVTFRSRLDYFNAENHNSVPLLSLYLGTAYAVKGEKSLAIRNHERAIELDPNRHSAIEALKKLK